MNGDSDPRGAQTAPPAARKIDGADRLDQRIRRVLAKLSMLSEAPASNIGGEKINQGKAEDRPPSAIPEALLWHYRQAFEDATTTEARRWELVYQAERDLDERAARKDASWIAGHPERTGEDYEALILTIYEGRPALEVAVRERQKVGWVRKLRDDDGRHPETGAKRPAFPADTSDRRRVVARFARQRWTIRQVADWFGVGRSTVHRSWPLPQTT